MVDYYGNSPQDRKVGAAEKRMKAKMYNSSSGNRGGTQSASPTISIAVAFFIAAVLAMLLTDGPLVNGVDLSLHPMLDPYLFGPGYPDLLGAPDMNRLAAVLIRGIALFVAAGIVPAFTCLWQRMLNKQTLSPYVAMWLSTMIIALTYCVVSLGMLPF